VELIAELRRLPFVEKVNISELARRGGVLNFVYPDFRQETAAFVWRHDEHKAQR
jgi:hypothetical protein